MEAPRAVSGDPFVGLRRDHERVLLRLAELEPAVPADAPADEVRLREFVAYLERQFATHMRAEDAVLFPAFRTAFPEARGTIEPLLADHAELRELLAGLGALLDRTSGPERGEQISVLARDLADLLRLHIRREESVLMDVAWRVLSREELATIAAGLEAWRQAHPETEAPPKGH